MVLEVVKDKTFRKGDTVWLDGKHFINCRFHGCILGYAATGDYRLTQCDMQISGFVTDGLASSTVEFLLNCGVTDLSKVPISPTPPEAPEH